MMIDIIQAIGARNPGLGTAFIVLRPDSRALEAPDRLTAEARAWIERETPGARLSRETVLLAPYPGAPPSERAVTVLAFREARQLAAFATVWTADPLPDGGD